MLHWVSSFSLLDQLAFYGAYHNNKWNQLIHFVFVPVILWTLLVWCAYSGPVLPGDLPDKAAQLHLPFARWCVENVALVVVSVYSAFYIVLDVVAGVSWMAAIALPLWLSATAFASLVPHAWAWAIGLHILAWYMQIHPGHAVLEKRKPALLDSFFQSLALAPLFVWFELLFVLGYRPRLRAALQQRVDADITAWRARDAKAAAVADQHSPLLSTPPSTT